MKQKTLLLTKAFVALVAMLFSVNAFAAVPTRPFTHTKVAGQQIDDWTTTIKIAINDNLGGTDYTVDYNKVSINNAEESWYVTADAATTFDADLDGVVDEDADGNAILTVVLTERMGKAFAGHKTTNYQVTFQEGAIITTKAQIEGCSENFKYSSVLSSVDWTMNQTSVIFLGENKFKFTLTATSAPVNSEITMTDIAANSAILDLLKKANASDISSPAKIDATTLVAGVNATPVSGNVIEYEVTLKKAADKNFVFKCGAEAANIAEGTEKSEERQLNIVVSNPKAISLEVFEAPAQTDQIEKYTIKFKLNGNDFPAKTKYNDTYKIYVLGGSKIYPNVVDVQEEKGNGVYELQFSPELTINSGFIIAAPRGAISNEEETLYNGVLLETDMVFFVDGDFHFYDTYEADGVTVKSTNKKDDIKDKNLWNVKFDQIYYHRYLNDALNAMAVPFNITASDVKDQFTIYRINTVEEEEGKVSLKLSTLADDEVALANYPYYIKGKNSGAGEVTAIISTVAQLKAPGVDKTFDVYYTEAEINEMAWKTDHSLYKKAGMGTGTYIELGDDAHEYNLHHPLAVDWTNESWSEKIDPNTGDFFVSVDAVKAYNASLPGAKDPSAPSDVEILYDDETAYDYNINVAMWGGKTTTDMKSVDNNVSEKVNTATTHDYFNFYNTSIEKAIPGEYYFVNKNGKLTFRQDSDKALRAWRWYMTVTDKKVDYINVYVDDELVEGDEATSIKNAIFGEEAKSIFNLNGLKVAAPVKGINIINGKKVLK